jgi:type I restriction enzyme M protein
MARMGKKQSHQVSLETELWAAAVKLRGNVAPADYKHYVLPLLFLRYLSLRYDQRQQEIRLHANEQQATFKVQVDIDDILNDPDEYTSHNVYVLPEQARWSFLVRSAQKDDIKQIVDDALEAVEKTHPKLQGILPRIYVRSNLDPESVRGIITLFSKDVFAQTNGHALDMLGKTYEYFIGNFASTEGARGGEFFTPESIVRVLVECMEPKSGVVFDPACGSGGMFVQSDRFSGHRKELAFYGQERIDTTLRLSKMNLILHGLDGDIRLGNSLLDDQHPDLKADVVIANPPFNQKEWGADRLDPKDARLQVDGKRYAVPENNANYMWLLHFLHHLKDGGTAGTVMANGALNTSTREEFELRKAFIDAGLVDCIIQLPEKLFSQTGIPCSLWIFSKSRDGQKGHRKRKEDVFFIDARGLGKLKEGSRKQKELAEDEIAKIAQAYHLFRNRDGQVLVEAGLCCSGSLEDIRKAEYKLTPGVYVGTGEAEDDGEPFEDKLARLTSQLEEQFAESTRLQATISENLASVRRESP